MSALMGVAGAWISPSPSHGLAPDSGGVKAPSLVKQDGGKNKQIVGGISSSEGVLTGDPNDGVKWRVTVPGSQVKNSDTLTIKEEHKQDGSTFTVKENGVTLYRVRDTAECLREPSASDCSQTLYPEAGGAGGKTTVKIDDDADTVDVTYANGKLNLLIRTGRKAKDVGYAMGMSFVKIREGQVQHNRYNRTKLENNKYKVNYHE